MKNLFKILMVVVGVQSLAYSQCNNHVLTNPAGPTNDQLPDVDGVVGGTYTADTRFLNKLPWWTGNYHLANMNYNPTQPYGDMVNIQSPNSGANHGYYKYLSPSFGGELMTPKNGWEILLVNLGYYPDNLTTHSYLNFNHIPFIVLYNKYTAVMRVFVQYGYNEPVTASGSGVAISLTYYGATGFNNLSGILRTANGGDLPLDQPSPIDQIVTAVPTAGGSQYWMSADFQMAYDPCVCSKPTIMTLGFDFYKVEEVELHGRSIGVEHPIDNIIDASGNVNDEDNNFLEGLNNSTGNGYVIYDQLKDMATEYRDELKKYNDELNAATEHNDKVERNLAILNYFIDIANVGLAAATGGTSWAVLAAEAPDVFFDSNDPEGAEKKEGFYDAVEEILGERVNEFISKKFEKVELPEEPVRPTATYTEMKFVGTIKSSQSLGGPTFTTPGAFNNATATHNDPVYVDVPQSPTPTPPANLSPYGYPIYNQPLGVFALLETPTVASSYIKSNTMARTGPFTDSHPSSPFSTGASHYHFAGDYDNRYQFKLQNPLKYTFNPALNIDHSNIECALVITPKNRHYVDRPGYGFHDDVTPHTSDAFVNTRKVYDKSVNLESDQINTYASEIIMDREFSPPVNDQASQLDELSYITPYMDINAFQTYVSQIKTETDIFNVFPGPGSGFPWIDNTNQYGMFWEAFDVQLKIKVNVTYTGVNEAGNSNDFTYLYTYPVTVGTQSSTDLYANLSGSAGDVEQYPENLIFDGTAFDGSAVEGCTLSGTTYTCKSWNDITIENTLTASAGYQVNFIAGHEIFALPPSYIPPTMNLSIAPVLNYSSPMPETNGTAVAAFCASASYKGDQKGGAPQMISTSTGSGHPTSSVNSLGQGQFVDFEIYPNPTKTGSKVKILADEETAGTIQITDVTGKTVESSAVKAGFNLYEIDLRSYKSGVYFITVITNQGSSTKQLIKE